MSGTNVESRERQRRDHEDDRGPCGEPGEHVGGGAGSEGGLRALPTEGSGKVGGAALLQEDDSNEEQADHDMEHDDEIEKNLHCESCFQKPYPVGPGRRVFGAEEGIPLRLPEAFS